MYLVADFQRRTRSLLLRNDVLDLRLVLRIAVVGVALPPGLSVAVGVMNSSAAPQHRSHDA